MRSTTRRGLLLGSGLVVGAVGTARFLSENISPGLPYPPEASADPLLLNDAGELSPVRIAKHITLREKPDDALVATLRAELKEAQSQNRPVVAHTARHSMGGQSLARDGHAITLDQQWIEVDGANLIYRVAAGTRWSTVIRTLDSFGFSPKVMQSNNDFGVASTFSVNAHGWPVSFSGGGTTARSIKMLLADGNHITCSRTENPDLFRAALGGYGLIGLITELEMEMVPNALLKPTFTTMMAEDFGRAFATALRDTPAIQMAYGRLNVDINNFFDEALMITYTPDGDQQNLPAATGSGFVSRISRNIFRQQVDSERWKRWRWTMETDINQMVNAGSATRNSLLNEPVITLDDRDPQRTDILHEYFVAPERFADFVKLCRAVIPSSYQQLLNITLRFVDTDQDSVLAYATVPRIASVLLFSQEKSARAEADMARMTAQLIDGVIAMGGSYYLPYRPHASLDQFKRAYPRHGAFLNLKRRIDPGLAFQNGLWENYLGKI